MSRKKRLVHGRWIQADCIRGGGIGWASHLVGEDDDDPRDGVSDVGSIAWGIQLSIGKL